MPTLAHALDPEDIDESSERWSFSQGLCPGSRKRSSRKDPQSMYSNTASDYAAIMTHGARVRPRCQLRQDSVRSGQPHVRTAWQIDRTSRSASMPAFAAVSPNRESGACNSANHMPPAHTSKLSQALFARRPDIL
eukprot:4784335-Pleurochrysis_carterae.AAC.1